MVRCDYVVKLLFMLTHICIKLKMYQSNLINDYLDTFFLYYSNLKDFNIPPHILLLLHYSYFQTLI